ncbi:MAG: MCE family protein [Alphaproteobacteria bacterium]|nr:MCE family protein [Alphaproteobacteria bacterium]
MTSADPSGPVPPRPPAPRVTRWADLPWVWAIPVVALIIVGWLGLNAVLERGPTITITFGTGESIDAGRTTIRYKEVALGRVVRVGLTPDRNKVLVTAEMAREAGPLLRSGTEFWVVRPRVGFTGVSGLGTLVSGAYIGMLPGEGDTGARDFAGLERPPPEQGLTHGEEYVLMTDQLHGVGDGAPVYFHGVQVGEVTAHELSDRDGSVQLHIFIYEPHQVLIHDASRFWISSGFEISVNAQGLKLGTESVQTLLTGGVVFDTPIAAMAEPASPQGRRFRLYPDPAAAEAAADPLRVYYQVHFPGALQGLSVDTPVELRGLPIGRVSGLRLEYDPASDSLRVPVTLEITPHRIVLPGEPAPPETTGGTAVEDTNRMFERLIARGLRARLDSGNLLTGSRVVDLDFVDNAPPAQLVRAEPYPVLPSVAGSGMTEITQSASRFMDKLAALPIGELVGDVRDMIRHADTVVASPELKRSLQSLDRTLANAERTTQEAQAQIGPLLTRLNTAAEQLNATLALLGNDPRSSTDLAHTMGELKDAARSVRVLADYLERHPEALVAGKPRDGFRR